MAHTAQELYNTLFPNQTDPTPATSTTAADLLTRIRSALGSWVLTDDCHPLVLAAAKAAGAVLPGGWGGQTLGNTGPAAVANMFKSDSYWYQAYRGDLYDLDWTSQTQLSQYLKAGDVIRAWNGYTYHTMVVSSVTANDVKIIDNVGVKSGSNVKVTEHSLFDYTGFLDNSASVLRLKSEGVTLIQPIGSGNGRTPQLSVNDVQALESAGKLTFTVSLNQATSQDVTVNAYTYLGTALASQGDYIPFNNFITIKAGTTSTTVDVTLLNDTKAEGTETFELRLRNPKNATIGDGAGVGTIKDDDGGTTPALPKLTVNNLSVNEGGGTASVTVSLDRAATSDVTFNAATYVGSASGTAGDYTGFTSKAGTIKAGSRSTTITVAITNDTVVENTETFQVGVFDVKNAVVAQERGTVTIIDNDKAVSTPPRVSVGDASIVEGNGNAVFRLSLDKASSSDVTLYLTTWKGSANAGGSNTDYRGFVDQKAIIKAGSTSTTVSVPIIDDRVGEKTENFYLEISKATGATITQRRGVGTITDNDGGAFPAAADNQLVAAADATGSASRYGTDLLPSADGLWQASAAGDFNGDGYADIVVRDQVSGRNAVWFMQGAERIDGAFLPEASNLEWQIVGAADMNQDGATDLLWRNDGTGENALWLMNGTSRVDTVALPTTAKTEWRVGGVADMNGDENADILWRNQETGENAVWLMEGTERIDAVALPATLDQDWRMIGAGDVNEDGGADIVWHNRSTGVTAFWAFDGLTRFETGTLGQTADASWDAFAIATLDGSGGADILWRDPVGGRHAAWFVGVTSA